MSGDVVRRYHELWLESRGFDPHGHLTEQEQQSMSQMMERKRELDRIDREIAGAEARLKVMIGQADEYHAKFARALALEQKAEELNQAGRWADAASPETLARQLRGECEHRSEMMQYEAQALVGLRMKRQAILGPQEARP